MGGKTATSQSTIQVPPEVLAQYNAVNAQAEEAGAQPFQQYSTNPNAFVAPLTATQTAGIGNINSAQGTYSPYGNAAVSALGGASMAADPLQAQAAGNINSGLGAGLAGTAAAVGAGQSYLSPATSLTAASAGPVNAGALGAAQIGQYMSPYNNSVVQSTLAALQQQQGQDQSTLQGQQIMSGAFGGSRAALDQANLARQQELTTAQTVSGLENQNYSQALGAAQQQQGVVLGAGQANRTALGAAGAQLGQLGAQDYSQLSGAANQNYNMGLGAASAQGALGQQVYGQGVTNATTLSGLGTTAQSNQLNAGNAQIAAGTTQQQTEQAGLQALYNQFLQQQGYPFQVAQFEAGVAEGTGALSGSTTTSTQPTSFFGGLSDARMKENIQPIGKTFDGQNIVKFRYKGKKKTEVGLVAQEVEKHAPHAVKEHGGLKYVDYDRATKRAAARGHFADGGASNNDAISTALAIQKAMYPFGSESGSRTGGGSGPWGTGLSQPSGRKLMTVPAPKMTQTNDLHDLANDTQDVATIGQGVKDASSFVKGLGKADIVMSGTTPSFDTTSIQDPGNLPGLDLSDPSNDNPLYRGGVARRKRASGGSGGMPYNVSDPYVPDDDDQLQTPQQLKAAQIAMNPNSQSGLGQAAGAIKDVEGIGKAAETVASFFNRGGLARARRGYADAGAVDDAPGSEYADLENTLDPNYIDPSQSTMALGASADRAEEAREQAAWDKESGPSRIVRNIENLWKKNISGGELDPGPTGPGLKGADVSSTTPASTTQTTTPHTAVAKAAPAPQADLPNTDVGPVPHQPMGIAQEPAALGAADTQVPSPATAASTSPPSSSPSQSDGKGWYGRNAYWLTPLLKGVGTMASSPSRYLGTALLQGVGAGAAAYQPEQQAEAKTATMQAEAQQQQQKTAQGDTYVDAQGYRQVLMPNNKTMRYTDWVAAGSPPTRNTQGAIAGGAPTYGTPVTTPSAPASSAPPGPNDDLPQSEKQFAQAKAADMMKNPNYRDAANYQAKDSPFNDIRADANVAYDATPQMNELTSALARAAANKNAGPVSTRLNEVAMAVNDGLSHMGINYQIRPEQLADSQEINKLSTMFASQAAASGHQNSYAGLDRILQQIPGNVNSPDGMRSLASDIMIQQQRAKDLDTYASKMHDEVAKNMGGDGGTANFSGEQVIPRFNNLYGKQYGADKQNLQKMFSAQVTDPTTGQRVPMFDYLSKHGTEIGPKHLQQISQKYGGLSTLRYFGLQ